MTREQALKRLEAIRTHGRNALGQDARGPYQAGAEDLFRELDAAGAFETEDERHALARDLAEARETIKDGLEDRIKCHLEDCVACTRRRAENQTALAWLNRVARLLANK